MIIVVCDRLVQYKAGTKGLTMCEWMARQVLKIARNGQKCLTTLRIQSMYPRVFCIRLLA